MDARQIGLKYVISRLPWYIELVHLLNATDNHTKFDRTEDWILDEIINLYAMLIGYQLKGICSYHHSCSTFAKNMVKWDDWSINDIKDSEQKISNYISEYRGAELQQRLSHIDGNIAKVRDSISQTSQKQVDLLTDIRDSDNRRARLLEKDRITKRTEELMGKFKPDQTQLDLEIYEEYVSQIASPHESTGRGVLTHPKFTQWTMEDTGILVLAAHPGTGKSVLAKHLLQELPNYKPTTICSFFFKDNSNQGQNKARIALCKILYELFKHCDTLDDKIEAKASKLSRYEIQPDSKPYWDLLNWLIPRIPYQRLIIAMDALDECDLNQISGLLQELKNFNTLFPNSKLKFLLTTRPLPSILEKITESTLNLDDDLNCRESINRDIIEVTKVRLNTFCKGKDISDETKKELLDRIRSGNDRTYLFVDLLFKYLERQGRQPNQKKWAQKFRELPTDLWDSYTALLKSVREDQQGDVRKMLEIVIAATRPLTLSEMNIALAVHDEDYTDCAKEEELGSSSPDQFKSWILDACGFFFDIYNDRIYFIHLTAEEYLLDDNKDSPDWLSDFNIESCHQTIAPKLY